MTANPKDGDGDGKVADPKGRDVVPVSGGATAVAEPVHPSGRVLGKIHELRARLAEPMTPEQAAAARAEANDLKREAENPTAHDVPGEAGEVTDAMIQDWYDNHEVPDGWQVHGRSKNSKDLNTGHAIQTTADLDVANQYAGKAGKGSVWYLRPTDTAIQMDLVSEVDRRKVATQLVDDVESGKNTPIFADQLVEELGRDKAIDKLTDDLDVTDIVDSAKLYDDDGFNGWLYDRHSVDWVNVASGAIVLNANDRTAVEARKVGKYGEARQIAHASKRH